MKIRICCAVLAAGFVITVPTLPSPDSASAHEESGDTALTHLPGSSHNQTRTYQPSDEQRYDWPTRQPTQIIRSFAVGEFNWIPGHRGVDLKTAPGDLIYAPAAGKVVYSGILNDRHVISILHDDGIRTTYEPVIPAVVQGQHIEAHEVIGTVDGTHCAPAACLHWGAKRGRNDYLNPLSLLEGPIVLLK